MPHDFAVPALKIADPARSVGSGPRQSAPGLTAPAALAAAPLFASPTLHLDAQLHILVMEFHDPTGNVIATVPTARQLQAYRLSALTSAPAAVGSPRSNPPGAPGGEPANGDFGSLA